MARGEQRGNREAKKPKKEKPKEAIPTSPFAHQGKHPGEAIRWQAIASWRIDLRTAPLDALFEHDHARQYDALAERIHERASIDWSFLTGTFRRA